jgi:hypothetical protein
VSESSTGGEEEGFCRVHLRECSVVGGDGGVSDTGSGEGGDRQNF